jgi:molybdopterin-guanine dinucleotide biosynthesis protein A
MEDAAALILNGGRSRRMGGADKSRIVVEGETILERQRQVLAQRFDAIAMVGDTRPAPDSPLMHSLPDRVGGKGPLDGIAAGLAWSPHDWLFVLASDMPYPSLPLLDALLDRRHESCDLVCVVIEERAQPLFALYHRRLLPIVDQRLAQGLLRVRELVREATEGVRIEEISESSARELDPELLSFRNFNRPEDVLTSGPSIE